MRVDFIVPDRTEQMFGGVKPSLNNRGRRLIKAFAGCLISVSMLAMLTGCSSGGTNTTEKDQQAADYETQKAIEQQIEDTALPKGYATLLADGDFVTALCSDGEATVTVKAYANFAIPYVAEKFLPAAQEAAEAAGATLAEFDVDSYNTNKDGVVDGTFASWHTKDGSTGTFTDQTDGETVVEPSWTLEQLYDHFADYEDIVKGMIEEAGGSYE